MEKTFNEIREELQATIKKTAGQSEKTLLSNYSENEHEQVKSVLNDLEANKDICRDEDGNYFTDREALAWFADQKVPWAAFDEIAKELKTAIRENPGQNLETLFEDYDKDNAEQSKQVLKILEKNQEVLKDENGNYFPNLAKEDDRVLDFIKKSYCCGENMSLDSLASDFCEENLDFEIQDFENSVDRLLSSNKLVQAGEENFPAYFPQEISPYLSDRIESLLDDHPDGLTFEDLKEYSGANLENTDAAGTQNFKLAMDNLTFIEGKIFCSPEDNTYLRTEDDRFQEQLSNMIHDGILDTKKLSETLKTSEEIIKDVCKQLNDELVNADTLNTTKNIGHQVVFLPDDKVSPPVSGKLLSLDPEAQMAQIHSFDRTIPVHLDKGEIHPLSRSTEQEQSPKRSSDRDKSQAHGNSQRKSDSHGR